MLSLLYMRRSPGAAANFRWPTTSGGPWSEGLLRTLPFGWRTPISPDDRQDRHRQTDANNETG